MDYKTMLKQAIEEKTSLILNSKFLKRGSGKTTSLLDMAFEYNLPIIVGDRNTLEHYSDVLGKKIAQYNDHQRKMVLEELSITEEYIKNEENKVDHIWKDFISNNPNWRIDGIEFPSSDCPLRDFVSELMYDRRKHFSVILVTHSTVLSKDFYPNGQMYMVDESVKNAVLYNCFTDTKGVFIGFSV